MEKLLLSAVGGMIISTILALWMASLPPEYSDPNFCPRYEGDHPSCKR